MSFSLNTQEWAVEQFGACELGDKRRTKRLIQMAQQAANLPAASFPKQMQTWDDLRAAYRLFDAEEVTFAAVAGPHWRKTRSVEAGRYLILADTTTIDFGYGCQAEGLSQVGNGSGKGFLLHNGLLVEARSRSLIGLAGQTIHYRKKAPQKENQSQRFKRERESRVWKDLIDQIGPPAEGVEWVHVCDRGADDFEVYCHLRENRSQWVVRASSQHRLILTPKGQEQPLGDYLQTLPVAGTYQLHLRARPKQPARTAKLEVRFGALSMPVPRHQTPYVRALQPEPIAMSVVWVREIDAPSGVEPIEWVLFTSLAVKTFEDAWQVVEYYEGRWLIEEFHKALKSGCSVEHRQLKSAERLEAMMGLMSVVAVRLLQLKTVARVDPDRPARSVVPVLWLQMLKVARKGLRSVHNLTIYQFYRELAKLGGFLGRKSDGEPGWITIWRGWEHLNLLVTGAELSSQLKTCG